MLETVTVHPLLAARARFNDESPVVRAASVVLKAAVPNCVVTPDHAAFSETGSRVADSIINVVRAAGHAGQYIGWGIPFTVFNPELFAPTVLTFLAFKGLTLASEFAETQIAARNGFVAEVPVGAPFL